MTTEAQAKEAFEAIGQVLNQPATKSISITGVCDQYRKIKKYLELALPWIERLPYGATLSMAIKLLMSLADMACPAPSKT